MRRGLVDSLTSPRKKRKIAKGVGDSDLPSFVSFEFGGVEVRARLALKPNVVLSLNTGFAPIFEAIAKEADSDDTANNSEDKTPVKMPDGSRCYPGRLMAAHAHTHTRAQLHTRTHAHTQTHTHTLARMRAHAPGHARAHTHPTTHTHAHRDTHTYTFTLAHKCLIQYRIFCAICTRYAVLTPIHPQRGLEDWRASEKSWVKSFKKDGKTCYSRFKSRADIQ